MRFDSTNRKLFIFLFDLLVDKLINGVAYALAQESLLFLLIHFSLLLNLVVQRELSLLIRFNICFFFFFFFFKKEGIFIRKYSIFSVTFTNSF